MGGEWCRGGSRAEGREKRGRKKEVSEEVGERERQEGGRDEQAVEREEEEGSKVRDHRRRLDLEEVEAELSSRRLG